MTVALRSPELVSGLIPVDNAPVNAALKGDFPKYVRGMQHVEKAQVSKQSDANKILEDYEEVSGASEAETRPGYLTPSMTRLTFLFSPFQSASSFSPTSSAQMTTR